MNQKIRVGLIGSGGMAKSRSRCLKESIDAGYDIGQLTAVCDLIEERAHSAADMAEELLGHRPRVFTDYRRMLDEDIVDAVDVVTDHRSHHTIVNDSLGRDVTVWSRSRSPSLSGQLAACSTRRDGRESSLE